MEFLDLQDYTTVHLHDYYKQTVLIDAEYIFNLPLNEADQIIQKGLKIKYVDKTVFVQFIFSHITNDEDFELLTELCVSSFIDQNCKDELREKTYANLPPVWRDKVNADLLTLKQAVNHQYYNRYINIQCASDDDAYRFDLISKAKIK